MNPRTILGNMGSGAFLVALGVIMIAQATRDLEVWSDERTARLAKLSTDTTETTEAE